MTNSTISFRTTMPTIRYITILPGPDTRFVPCRSKNLIRFGQHNTTKFSNAQVAQVKTILIIKLNFWLYSLVTVRLMNQI